MSDILLNANLDTVEEQLNAIAEMCHRLNKNWWINLHTGNQLRLLGI